MSTWGKLAFDKPRIIVYCVFEFLYRENGVYPFNVYREGTRLVLLRWSTFGMCKKTNKVAYFYVNTDRTTTAIFYNQSLVQKVHSSYSEHTTLKKFLEAL